MTAVTATRPHMPDYGVDTADWEPLPWSWAATRLDAARNFWLVTATADGRPHAMPVWGVWSDADLRFACSCAPNARKARNLADNPRAVVAGEDTVECVSIEGSMQRVTDRSRVDIWVQRYLDKYQPLAPGLDADFLLANAIFELSPERGFGIIEREEEFSRRATRWLFG